MALLLASGALALGVAGCGDGSSHTLAAGKRLERDDLIAVARALAAVQGQVGAEVRTTKAAWPAVADGLPARLDAGPTGRIESAAASAEGLRVPTLFQEQGVRTLTGAASGIAGTFHGYSVLSEHGWRMILGAVQQVAHGTSASATFARANVALYIDTVYDAHFALAQIGKKLVAAYKLLGGEEAFGSELTNARVQALGAAYSEPRDRLYPHSGVKLGS